MDKQKLILGTVQFGLNYGISNSIGKPTEIEVFEILNYAFENGIRILDTAQAYGNAIEIIGKFHKKTGKIFKVITKFHYSNNVKNELIENLKVLNINQYEAILIHNINESVFLESIQIILELKNDHFTKKIGVSIYTNNEIEEVLKIKGVDIVQLPFNLLDNQNMRGDVLDKLKLNNIEVHSRSAFLQGLFFLKEDQFSLKLKPLAKYTIQINEIAAKWKINLSALALNYALAQSNIQQVLIGVNSLKELENNLIANDNIYNDKIQQEINNIFVQEIELLNPVNWK